jgi:hypothetical protein
MKKTIWPSIHHGAKGQSPNLEKEDTLDHRVVTEYIPEFIKVYIDLFPNVITFY